jgi:hypothetical protein
MLAIDSLRPSIKEEEQDELKRLSESVKVRPGVGIQKAFRKE